jgi:hypothetical protein
LEVYVPGAAWEDSKLGIEHWGNRRGSQWWIRDALRMLCRMLPGEVRAILGVQCADANAWITG